MAAWSLEDVAREKLRLEHLDEIAATVSDIKNRRDFDEQLIALAADYLTWIQQPLPSKECARYQLRLITYYALRSASEADGNRKILVELQAVLSDLNGLAFVWLCRELEAIGWIGSTVPVVAAELSSEEVSMLADAAGRASSAKASGDYLDPNIWFAVDRLIGIYELATAERATYSAYKANFSGSEIATSGCGKMIIAFFAKVDPKVLPTSASTVFRHVNARRRARRGVDKLPMA